jgi:formylglycine-generating enzyme required for sulfatase activity
MRRIGKLCVDCGQVSVRFFLLGICVCLQLGCSGGGSPLEPISQGQRSKTGAQVVSTPLVDFVTVTGFAVDGPLVNANIGVDFDHDGQLDASEVLTTTSTGGLYSLSYPMDWSGDILVKGGVDADLGLPFKGILKTKNPMRDAQNIAITPLTTLMAEGMSEESIKALFAVSSDINLSTANPANNLVLQRAGIRIHTMAMLLQAGAGAGAEIGDVYQRMSQSVDFGHVGIEDILISLGSSNPSPIASVIDFAMREIESIQVMDFLTSVQAVAMTSTVSAISDFENGLITADILALETLRLVEAPVVSGSSASITNSIGMTFVQIPAGSFAIGQPISEVTLFDFGEKWRRPTLPERLVKFSNNFYLAQHETTQEQWATVMDLVAPPPDKLHRPVWGKTVAEVKEFIWRLNEIEGHEKYRLPTWAEWEYSARAGKRTMYLWGDSSRDALGRDSYAWLPYNTRNNMNVGLKKPNAWGLFDVMGNVAELVLDTYTPEEYSQHKGVLIDDYEDGELKEWADPVHISESTTSIFNFYCGGSSRLKVEPLYLCRIILSDYYNGAYSRANGFRLLREE